MNAQKSTNIIQYIIAESGINNRSIAISSVWTITKKIEYTFFADGHFRTGKHIMHQICVST